MSDNYFPIENDLSWKDIASKIKSDPGQLAQDFSDEMESHHQELAELSAAREHGQLALDIYQTPADLVIQAPIAGVSHEDLDITIHEDILTIKGLRKRDTEIKTKNMIYQECHWGEFSRSVVLPFDVISDRVEASLKDGILTIRLPKASTSRKIKVKSK
jgi:HSP20 family molecular chaperone IbpA